MCTDINARQCEGSSSAFELISYALDCRQTSKIDFNNDRPSPIKHKGCFVDAQPSCETLKPQMGRAGTNGHGPLLTIREQVPAIAEIKRVWLGEIPSLGDHSYRTKYCIDKEL